MEALYANAHANLARVKILASQNALGKKNLDDAVASESSTRAQVLTAKAAVQNARLNLGFTKITSPLSGMAGIARAQVGDLVGPGVQGGELTTVSTIDPIKIYYTVDEQAYIGFMRRFSSEAAGLREAKKLHIELILADGSPYPQPGRFFVVDRQVDVRTGTLRVAALFPNPTSLLRPGQFVRVRVLLGTRKGVLVIPQRSVMELQGSYQVAVVGSDDRVEMRSVKPGERVGALWKMVSGLKPGERVVAEGLQKVKQGTAVQPRVFDPSFTPAPVRSVGSSGGVAFILEDRAGRDIAFLAGNAERFVAAAGKRPEFSRVSTTLLTSVPQYFVSVDRDKVLSQGVDLGQVYGTLQAFMGGQFVNYFNRFGRLWQVYVEADGDFRIDVRQLGQFYVRNSHSDPVPLAAVTRVEKRVGPEFTMRYNLYRSAQINASAAPGYRSAQAMRALEEVFRQTMPSEMGFDYLGMSFQEQKARESVPHAAIFALSLLFVFLILAGLYESWSLPFSVLLSTPIAVCGAFLVLLLRGMQFNIYAQIGLIVLIGLVGAVPRWGAKRPERSYASTARLRYDYGYTSYIEVLDAERTLFDAELAYTRTRGELLQALINLYKAMGGGWGDLPQVTKVTP